MLEEGQYCGLERYENGSYCEQYTQGEPLSGLDDAHTPVLVRHRLALYSADNNLLHTSEWHLGLSDCREELNELVGWELTDPENPDEAQEGTSQHDNAAGAASNEEKHEPEEASTSPILIPEEIPNEPWCQERYPDRSFSHVYKAHLPDGALCFRLGYFSEEEAEARQSSWRTTLDACREELRSTFELGLEQPEFDILGAPRSSHLANTRAEGKRTGEVMRTPLRREFYGIERYDDHTYSRVIKGGFSWVRARYKFLLHNERDDLVAESAWRDLDACREEVRWLGELPLSNPQLTKHHSGLARASGIGDAEGAAYARPTEPDDPHIPWTYREHRQIAKLEDVSKKLREEGALLRESLLSLEQRQGHELPTEEVEGAVECRSPELYDPGVSWEDERLRPRMQGLERAIRGVRETELRLNTLFLSQPGLIWKYHELLLGNVSWVANPRLLTPHNPHIPWLDEEVRRREKLYRQIRILRDILYLYIIRYRDMSGQFISSQFIGWLGEETCRREKLYQQMEILDRALSEELTWGNVDDGPCQYKELCHQLEGLKRAIKAERERDRNGERDDLRNQLRAPIMQGGRAPDAEKLQRRIEFWLLQVNLALDGIEHYDDGTRSRIYHDSCAQPQPYRLLLQNRAGYVIEISRRHSSIENCREELRRLTDLPLSNPNLAPVVLECAERNQVAAAPNDGAGIEARYPRELGDPQPAWWDEAQHPRMERLEQEFDSLRRQGRRKQPITDYQRSNPLDAGIFRAGSRRLVIEHHDDGTYSKVYTEVRHNQTSYLIEFYSSDDIKLASSDWHTEISSCRTEIRNHTSSALENPQLHQSARPSGAEPTTRKPS